MQDGHVQEQNASSEVDVQTSEQTKDVTFSHVIRYSHGVPET